MPQSDARRYCPRMDLLDTIVRIDLDIVALAFVAGAAFGAWLMRIR